MYANEFTLSDEFEFRFEAEFVTSMQHVKFETILPKDTKIVSLECFRELEGNRYGSKITFSNGKTFKVKYRHVDNNMMLFRVENIGYFIIPEHPKGKLIICDIPIHLFAGNVIDIW
jgi:hypothetical protein